MDRFCGSGAKKASVLQCCFIGVDAIGESPSWLRHRILIPACEGSSPSSPATCSTHLIGKRDREIAQPAGGCLVRPVINFLHCPMSSASDFMLFTGNANPVLAQEIASHLGTELGQAHVGRFSDGEVTVELMQNVRARDVFVIQSTCAPTNENLMELLIMVDALKRASAERISAVIPYFGYARQDRRPRSTRVPISAKVVANLLQTVGVARVLTMDLHADQIQGFFDIPVDHLFAAPVIIKYLQSKNLNEPVVVSPNVWKLALGAPAAKQDARRFATQLFGSDAQWRLALHHNRAEAALIGAWYVLTRSKQ